LNARIEWPASAGETYYLRVSAVGATPSDNFQGDLVIDVACCGSAAAGSCFEDTNSPFCDKRACCEAVCAVDIWCCDMEWDTLCANRADTICATCGGEGAGGCYIANGTPACNRTECCNDVCAIDAYCCDTAWDALCVDEANELCGLVAYGHPHVPLGDAELSEGPARSLHVGAVGASGADGVAIFAGGLPAGTGAGDPVTSAEVALTPDAWPAPSYLMLSTSMTNLPPNVPAGLLQIVNAASGVINIYAGLLGPQTFTVQLYHSTNLIDEAVNVEGSLVCQAIPTVAPAYLGAAVQGGELAQWARWDGDMLMVIPDHAAVTCREVVVTSEYSGSPDDSAVAYLSVIAVTGAAVEGFTITDEEVQDCPWDCGDQNGQVAVVDFLALLAQWDTAGSCDVDLDGTVNVVDFLQILGHWGPCP
jgi:hypothetical protein